MKQNYIKNIISSLAKVVDTNSPAYAFAATVILTPCLLLFHNFLGSWYYFIPTIQGLNLIAGILFLAHHFELFYYMSLLQKKFKYVIYQFVRNLYIQLIFRYITRLMLRTLLLRTIVSLSIWVLLKSSFFSASTVYTVVIAFLVLYYISRLLDMLKSMSLIDAVSSIITTLTIISVIWFIISCIFSFILIPIIFSLDIVFILEDGGSSSDSSSDSGSSSNHSSPKGPGNHIEPGDLPDAGPMAECEHTGHWYLYPDLTDPDIRCDFGGTPGPDGKIMATHSAYCSSGDPMLCNFCHAIGCHDCINLPDEPSGDEMQAGPSVQSGNDAAATSNESKESTDTSRQNHNNDYDGKGKGKAV